MSNNDNDLIADIILYTKQIVNSILLSEITDSYKLEQITNKIAFELASVIEEDRGGQYVYVRLNSPTRKQRIYSEFTGTNYRELSKKYKISEHHIRKIIKQIQKERQEQNQPMQGSLV